MIEVPDRIDTLEDAALVLGSLDAPERRLLRVMLPSTFLNPLLSPSPLVDDYVRSAGMALDRARRDHLKAFNQNRERLVQCVGAILLEQACASGAKPLVGVAIMRLFGCWPRDLEFFVDSTCAGLTLGVLEGDLLDPLRLVQGVPSDFCDVVTSAARSVGLADALLIPGLVSR